MLRYSFVYVEVFLVIPITFISKDLNLRSSKELRVRVFFYTQEILLPKTIIVNKWLSGGQMLGCCGCDQERSGLVVLMG